MHRRTFLKGLTWAAAAVFVGLPLAQHVAEAALEDGPKRLLPAPVPPPDDDMLHVRVGQNITLGNARGVISAIDYRNRTITVSWGSWPSASPGDYTVLGVA